MHLFLPSYILSPRQLAAHLHAALAESSGVACCSHTQWTAPCRLLQIDSLCQSRGGMNGSEGAQQVLTELLIQMDSVSSPGACVAAGGHQPALLPGPRCAPPLRPGLPKPLLSHPFCLHQLVPGAQAQLVCIAATHAANVSSCRSSLSE